MKSILIWLVGITTALSMFTTSVSAQVMVGAYVPADGWSRSNITEVNDALTKNLAYVNVFSGFAHSWQQLKIQSNNIAAEGAMPMISWMPIDSSRRSDNLLPEIIAGEWDQYIDNWADGLIAWAEADSPSNKRILLRFAHEFNGNWYSYSGKPGQLKRAWRRIHRRFERRGANQYIDWVWCANNVSVDRHQDIRKYYPGDRFVDWTALDGYNWGSNYAWSHWKSFAEVFSDGYNTLIANYPNKPVMIAETGSAEPADIPDAGRGQNGDDSDALYSKRDWVAEMMLSLQTDFPAIRALTLFNTNKELGWSLTGPDNTGLAQFNDALASDYFTSDYSRSSHN